MKTKSTIFLSRSLEIRNILQIGIRNSYECVDKILTHDHSIETWVKNTYPTEKDRVMIYV